MTARVKWSDDDIRGFVDVLGGTPREQFSHAIELILASKPGATYGALKQAFSRYGWKSPTSYCGLGGSDVAVEIEDFGHVDIDEPTEPAPPPDTASGVEPERAHRYEPLDLGGELERILIIPDTHAPYHDVAAWGAMMRFARGYKPHTVIHLGDWIDCLTVSDHDRDPRRASQLEDELRVTKDLRAEVDSLDPERKFISLGNHEAMLLRYMVRHAPALIGLLDIAQLLELPQNGWHVTPYMEDARIGHLRWTHGTDHVGQYSIFQNGTTFGSSIVCGHTHRLASTYFGDADDGRHVSASLGWLGSRPAATYMHGIKKRRFWQHGFGTAEMTRDGRFELHLKPIVDGRVISQ